MKRRTLLTSAAAASVMPVPAIGSSARQLRLVSAFPKWPGLEDFARTLTTLSRGRLEVQVFGPGELVDSFEVFDAVSEGIADMYFSTEYYWVDRSPAYSFFTTVPFGLTASETAAWVYRGGGDELWDELSANFNIKPLLANSSGVQMGGWYNREVHSIEDFRGLRLRMPGLGGEVMRRLGAAVVNLPPGDIVTAMKSGALDAAEWVGPDDDMNLGLHTAARYYYYPGFHEPGTANAIGINRNVWTSLEASDRELIETGTRALFTLERADMRYLRVKALTALTEKHGIQLREFDDEILREFGRVSGEVLAELGATDAFTRRVYDSYMSFLKASRAWSNISDRAYLNARELGFAYGA